MTTPQPDYAVSSPDNASTSYPATLIRFWGARRSSNPSRCSPKVTKHRPLTPYAKYAFYRRIEIKLMPCVRTTD
jgi:hypothetical protein